jgi:hypothetical protein
VIAGTWPRIRSNAHLPRGSGDIQPNRNKRTVQHDAVPCALHGGCPYMTTNKSIEHITPDRAENQLALDAKLDAALADTFPASDPVAITVSVPRPARDPR